MSLRYSLLAATFALLLTACGDDQTVDPGANQTPASDGGADASGVVVQVSFDGQSKTLDLGTLPTTEYKGVNLIKVSDLWTASQFGVDPATLEFEFVSTDGFKPSVKDCADLPGNVIDKGFLDPTSRNLTWDESLGYPGCYSVKEVAEMNAHAPTPDDGTTDAGE